MVFKMWMLNVRWLFRCIPRDLVCELYCVSMPLIGIGSNLDNLFLKSIVTVLVALRNSFHSSKHRARILMLKSFGRVHGTDVSSVDHYVVGE